MTLVVENGSGVTGAESYAAVAQIDSYAEKFGKDAWLSLALPVKEKCARLASRFIDNKYPFPQNSKTATQGLLFPLTSLSIRGFPVTGVPLQVVDACCELSIICSTNELMESVSGRAYTYRSVSVGDIKKAERFRTTNDQPIFHTVELILRPLLSDSLGGGIHSMKIARG